MTPEQKRKPTRRDLLVVIGRLQSLVGRARGAYGNDRDPNRYDRTTEPLDEAHELCVSARSYDGPIESRQGPWGAPLPPETFAIRAASPSTKPETGR